MRENFGLDGAVRGVMESWGPFIFPLRVSYRNLGRDAGGPCTFSGGIQSHILFIAPVLIYNGQLTLNICNLYMKLVTPSAESGTHY